MSEVWFLRRLPNHKISDWLGRRVHIEDQCWGIVVRGARVVGDQLLDPGYHTLGWRLFPWRLGKLSVFEVRQDPVYVDFPVICKAGYKVMTCKVIAEIGLQPGFPRNDALAAKALFSFSQTMWRVPQDEFLSSHLADTAAAILRQEWKNLELEGIIEKGGEAQLKENVLRALEPKLRDYGLSFNRLKVCHLSHTPTQIWPPPKVITRKRHPGRGSLIAGGSFLALSIISGWLGRTLVVAWIDQWLESQKLPVLHSWATYGSLVSIALGLLFMVFSGTLDRIIDIIMGKH